MRLGVLDIGSNTVHFLVVDAHRGARPLPAFSHKAELRLADHLEDGNRLTPSGAKQLRAFVSEALRIAEDKGVEDVLPFGAGRLTRTWLTGDPPSADQVRRLRKHVRTEIARTASEVLRNGRPDHAVATSKTFRQLARIAGAVPSGEGIYIRRNLRHAELTPWASRLATMNAAQRAQLPGVSATRAPQLLAGAVVADAAMDLFCVDELELCPWALREGVILQRLDGMAGRRDAADGRPGRG